MQLEGIDFFETYDPVFQWTTVILMLILEVLLGLKYKKGDVNADFLHVNLGEDEKVFVDMPQGFETTEKNVRHTVMKLKKTVCILRQIPRAFWKYMTSKTELCGMIKSKMDPCFFIGRKGWLSFMLMIFCFGQWMSMALMTKQ